MFKKAAIVLIGVMMLLMLCSCDSKEVKQAKAAYAEGNYAQVVELLSGQEDLDQEVQDMLAISEANVAYENKEYQEAVKKLAATSAGIESEQFDEMFTAALDDAVANKDSEAIIELLKLDESKANAIYDAVKKVCNDNDYNGFVLLDELAEKLDKGELKTKLNDFDKDNAILRAKSFMLGKWKETDEQGSNRTIEVTLAGDKMIGIIVKVDEDSNYKKNDVYWKDFEFLDKKRLTCISISRGNDGDANDNTAVGKINYKKGTLKLHLTPTSGHALTYYDTNWKRAK